MTAFRMFPPDVPAFHLLWNRVRSGDGCGVSRAALPSVVDAVAALRPDMPLHCVRPAALREQARRFCRLFPGDVLYAVKCNPDPMVLQALWDGGIRHFDVASLGEILMLRQVLPQAELHFMHPIKARRDIRESHRQGVRDFVLDSADELRKILEEIPSRQGLGLVVRLALPRGGAIYDLSGKFGASQEDAASLLKTCRLLADKIGLCFHVGSQCMEPADYEKAVFLARQVIAEAGVAIDILDVGGGFPVRYPGLEPPPLETFMAAIQSACARSGLEDGCRLWAEPGRALAAPGQSVVVRVLARRPKPQDQVGALFINDGVYGALSDASMTVKGRFPVRLIRDGGGIGCSRTMPFAFFGPTCDSADRMPGPFWLPEDIREGDWVEIGQLGAYGSTLRTGFNGFGDAGLIAVKDRPFLETPDYPCRSTKAA